MVGRVKFEVYGKKGWAVAYCKPELVEMNTHRFNDYGFEVRTDGKFISYPKRAA